MTRRIGWTIAEVGKRPHGLAPVFDDTQEGEARARRCAEGAKERTGVAHEVVPELMEFEDTRDVPRHRPGTARGIGTCGAMAKHPRKNDHHAPTDPTWAAWPGPSTGQRVEPRRRAE